MSMNNPLNFKEFIDYPINFQKKIEIQRKSLKSDIEIRIIAKGVYRVSIAKRPLLSTLPDLFAFYDFIK